MRDARPHRVVVDLAALQLQHGAPKGIARVWHGVLEPLARALASRAAAASLLLRRAGGGAGGGGFADGLLDALDGRAFGGGGRRRAARARVARFPAFSDHAFDVDAEPLALAALCARARATGFVSSGWARLLRPRPPRPRRARARRVARGGRDPAPSRRVSRCCSTT